MFGLILMIVLVIALVAGVLMWVFGTPTDDLEYDSFPTKSIGVIVAGVSLVVFGLTFLFSSFTIVGANETGVKVALGKEKGIITESGLQYIGPLTNVDKFPVRPSAQGEKCFEAKFAQNGKGTACISYYASVEPSKVKDAWLTSRNFEGLLVNAINSDSQSATTDVLAKYESQKAISPANYAAFAAEIEALANKKLASVGSKVERFRVLRVDPDQATQDRINELATVQANVALEIERKEVESKKAETAKQVQSSITPESLYRECLETLRNWDVNRQGQIPTTLNCTNAQPVQTLSVN